MKNMKKFLGWLLFSVVVIYLWFAIIPTFSGYSLPTAEWDWLGFTGVIVSVAFAVWGICMQIEDSNTQTKIQITENAEQVRNQIEASNQQFQKQIKENLRLMTIQQQLSVVPCLDVNAYTLFDKSNPNNTFRIFKEDSGKIFNDGYKIIRKPGQGKPDDFSPSVNIKVKNKGLSTAFQVMVYLYELKRVDGLSDLEEILKKPIEKFYDKIEYSNFEYYENIDDKEPNVYDWLISPQYSLTCDNGEFNLVFDTTKIKKKYHTILKFQFEDIYQNTYYHLMYVYFDKMQVAALPISKLYSEEKIANLF